MFSVGLVVGKFCPLHKGHEMVINTALAKCNKLVIISYTSLTDATTPAIRRAWLSALFPTAVVVVPESGYPNDDAPETEHRKYCFDICSALNVSPSAIFASEEYVFGFAEEMTALTGKHVNPCLVDKDRVAYPICGTALRKNASLRSTWCSDVVNAAYGKRILFIGAESSGKTTISEACSKHFANTAWVPEFGREMWDIRKGNLQYEDMLQIGMTQVQWEENAMRSNSLVFCDTSPLVTKFYSNKLFNKVDGHLDILAQRHYDFVFWCLRDFGYVEDGTRNGVEFGTEQERFYMANMTQPFVPLYGSVNDRLDTIANILLTQSLF